MIRIVLISATIFSLLAAFSPVESQVLIDVKTRYGEKQELHFVKLALITSLDSTEWSRTTEMGELFSVWLKNFKHIAKGDSIETDLDLEFRTPAMISEGHLISTKHLSIIEDTSSLSYTTASSDSLLSDLITQNLIRARMMQQFLHIWGVSSGAISGTPVVGYFTQRFVARFIGKFDRRPSSFETIEASMLAARALFEVHSFVTQRYPRAIKR
jgi:hypothetical protein